MNNIRSAVKSILIIYLICVVFRAIEYMLIRTDQSMIGEAFIHKLIGILILGITIRYLSLKYSDIGFASKAASQKIIYGLFLGMIVFLLAYGVEYYIYLTGEQNPSFQVYITSYTIQGNQGRQTEFIFFVICIIGNLINVVMEEGIFRGLFLRIAQTRYSFIRAVMLSSILFGLWHIAAPIRNLIDGEMSANGAIMYALMLIITTGITGIKFCLLTKITGSLWMPMADHFFNNTIINTLHIVTASGADELQTIRIAIAQTVSFLIVLILYWKSNAHNKPTFRS